MLDFSTLTTLRVTIEGHVADVAFNRPNELNAMNTAFFKEAKICMEALDRHPGAVHVLDGSLLLDRVDTGAGRLLVDCCPTPRPLHFLRPSRPLFSLSLSLSLYTAPFFAYTPLALFTRPLAPLRPSPTPS